MHTPSPQPVPPLAVGYGDENQAHPHWIVRERGTSSWLLEYSVRGRVRFDLGEAPRTEGPGFLFLFPPGARQCYGMDPDHGHWEHYWAWIRPRPEWVEWLDWPRVTEGLRGFHLPAGDLRRRAESIWREALDAFRRPFGPSAELTANLLFQLLLRCDEANPRRAQGRLDDRVRATLGRIAEHYAESLTAEDLAEAVHLSVSRLGHLFRAETGTPLMRYLEQVRMERARELLLMTSLPVADVGRKVGYENPFYFSRLFRRHAGLSPRAFRQGASPSE